MIIGDDPRDWMDTGPFLKSSREDLMQEEIFMLNDKVKKLEGALQVAMDGLSAIRKPKSYDSEMHEYHSNIEMEQMARDTLKKIVEVLKNA